MDKHSLSNYGWIIVVTLVLAVMLSFATPFGKYVGEGVVSVANGMAEAGTDALKEDNISSLENEWTGKFDYQVFEKDPAFNDGVIEYGKNDPDLNHKNLIPKGATYTMASTGKVLVEGDEFPETMTKNDIYIYGDYEYRYLRLYNQTGWDSETYASGWGVRVRDTSKANYGPILENINDKPIEEIHSVYKDCTMLSDASNMVFPSTVTSLSYTFAGCTSLTNNGLPKIPSNITSLHYTFAGCTALTDVSKLALHDGITNMSFVFKGCSNLTNAGLPTLPDNIQKIPGLFMDCTSITSLKNFVIPQGVTDVGYLCSGCTSLTNDGIPTVPNGINRMAYMYEDCFSLTSVENIVIPEGTTNISYMFNNCLYLTDASNLIIPNTVTNMDHTFAYCKKLKYAPVIPQNVTSMSWGFRYCYELITPPNIPSKVKDLYIAFDGCTSLTGTMVIDANPTTYTSCFSNVDFTKQNLTLTGSSTMLSELGATGKNYNN